MVEWQYTHTVVRDGFVLHVKASCARIECVRNRLFGYILSAVIVFVVGFTIKQDLFLFVSIGSCRTKHLRRMTGI